MGRGTGGEGVVTGGTACEAAVWESSSSLVLHNGKNSLSMSKVCNEGGDGPAKHGEGQPWECGAAVWQPNVGVDYDAAGGRCNQRAVVGLRVSDCCRAGAGQPGLQRQAGAHGARVRERGRRLAERLARRPCGSRRAALFARWAGASEAAGGAGRGCLLL